MEQDILHSAPYSGKNNRKWTLSRLKDMERVQSIPVYKKEIKIIKKKEYVTKEFLGYKYIYH